MKHYCCALAAAGDFATETFSELLWTGFKGWAEGNSLPKSYRTFLLHPKEG